MSNISKPINEIITYFDKDGMHPVKFKIEGKNGETTIKIDKIVKCESEKLAGNHMQMFTCEADFNGKKVPYVLKYELDTLKWLFFKI